MGFPIKYDCGCIIDMWLTSDDDDFDSKPPKPYITASGHTICKTHADKVESLFNKGVELLSQKYNED